MVKKRKYRTVEIPIVGPGGKIVKTIKQQIPETMFKYSERKQNG